MLFFIGRMVDFLDFLRNIVVDQTYNGVETNVT